MRHLGTRDQRQVTRHQLKVIDVPGVSSRFRDEFGVLSCVLKPAVIETVQEPREETSDSPPTLVSNSEVSSSATEEPANTTSFEETESGGFSETASSLDDQLLLPNLPEAPALAEDKIADMSFLPLPHGYSLRPVAVRRALAAEERTTALEGNSRTTSKFSKGRMTSLAKFGSCR